MLFTRLHDQEPSSSARRARRRQRYPRARVLPRHGLGGARAAPPATALQAEGNCNDTGAATNMHTSTRRTNVGFIVYLTEEQARGGQLRRGVH